MLSNAFEFAVFFMLLFGIYWLLSLAGRWSQNLFLVVASYVFYGSNIDSKIRKQEITTNEFHFLIHSEIANRALKVSGNVELSIIYGIATLDIMRNEQDISYFYEKEKTAQAAIH